EACAESRPQELLSRPRREDHLNELTDAALRRGVAQLSVAARHRQQRPSARWLLRHSLHGLSPVALDRGTGMQTFTKGSHQKIRLSRMRKMLSRMNAQMVMIGMLKLQNHSNPRLSPSW